MAVILVVDDSESARDEIRGVLKSAGLFDRILEAEDGIGGLKLLMAEPVDIVLCDLEMPGLDGEKLLRARGCRPDREEVPFVFLTANRDPARTARLLRAGASDSIVKPFHAEDLTARLEVHLRFSRLQGQLREKNAILEQLSTTDSLTGLRTRRFLAEALAREMQRARRHGTPLSVLMADLDHFKRVNDAYGHVVGDAVLRRVGALVRERLRGTDVAGRYGGEEFLIVLPETDLEGAEKLSERLRQAVEHASFDLADGEPLAMTVSIGVAALDEGVAGAEELIIAADTALYEAKEAGRNRVAVARPGRGLDSRRGSRTSVPGAGGRNDRAGSGPGAGRERR